MLILLSPAKTLSWSSAALLPEIASQISCPPLLNDADPVISVVKGKTKGELKKLMGISDNLADLNHERFKAMQTAGDARSAFRQFPQLSRQDNFNYRPAALTFDGPAYKGLQAQDFTPGDWSYAKKVLFILCGLYGLLRPLDLLQPYRLEMSTKVGVAGSKDLVSYWKSKLTTQVIESLAQDDEDKRVVVNVASQEYAKAVDLKSVREQTGCVVVNCVFKDDGRVLSVFAKRARGLMTRYIIKHQLTTVEQLKAFDLEGYSLQQVQGEATTSGAEMTMTFSRSKAQREAVRDAAAGGDDEGGSPAPAKQTAKKRKVA